MPPAQSTTLPSPKRPGIWGRLQLWFVLDKMKQLARTGADQQVVAVGERYLQRWTGSARFYTLLSTSQWSVSHWRDCIRSGRISLSLNPAQPKTVIILLAAYRSEKKLNRGITFGEHWLTKFGDHADVCRHLSFLYDDLDRTPDAIAVTQRGLRADPSDLRLASVTANYLAKTEGAASALRYAAPYRERFASDFYCENTLAEGLSASGAYAEAEPIFAALHTRHPTHSKVFGSLLITKVQLGKHEEVLAAIATWQKAHLLTGQIANEAGRAHLELGRHAESLEWLQRACELSPTVERYADNFASVLGKANRNEECIKFCERRLTECSPSSRLKLLTTLAIAHTELGQHESALRHYQQAATEYPQDCDAIANLVVGLNWLKRYAESVALGQAQQACPNAGLPIRFWSEFAWACHAAGNFEAEEQAICDWRRRAPDDANVVRAMNRCLNRQKRAMAALIFSRQWNAPRPLDAWGWRYLAEQCHLCAEPAEEIAAMEAACRLEEKNPSFIDFKLVVLRRNQRAAEALTSGEAWVAAHPDRAHAELLNRIGLAADDVELWPQAEDYYRRAHLKEPAGPVWFGNLCRALIIRHRPGEAVDLGQRWLAENPWDNYVAGKIAWALREAGRRTEETEMLRKALQTEPKDEELNYDLLNNLIAQHRTHDARELLEQCHRDGVATARFFNDWGNHLREVNQFGDAEAAFHRALEINPHSQTAAGNLALLMVQTNRISEATAYCQAWLARRPDDLYVRRQLANALYTADDIVPAELEYRHLQQQEPNSVYLLGRLIACLRLADRHEEVVTIATDWLKTHRGDAFIFTEIGISSGHLHRRDEALGFYEKALAQEPSWYAAALRKMRLLDEPGNLMQAVAFGEEWAAAHATEAGFQNELGILLDRAGQITKAEQRFRRAIELDANNPTLAGNAVEILCRQNRLAESIQLGHQLLEKCPPNAYLLRRIAETYSRNHEPMPALDLLETADVLDPRDVEVVKAYLRIADDADEMERGITFGRAWLARTGNEREASVWARLASLLFEADHEIAAVEALEHAQKLEPGQVRHLRTRFSFLYANGDTSRLIAEYEKLRDEWQFDATLMNYTSQSYFALGLENEALTLSIKNADANPGEAEAAACLATLHRKRGHREKALEWIERWTATHGEQAPVIQVRAEIALEQERYAAALKDIDALLAQDRADEGAFVLRIRALRALGRGIEARSELHEWSEHHKMSAQVTRLLEDDSSGDPWGKPKASGLDA